MRAGEASWHREGLLMNPISVRSSAQDWGRRISSPRDVLCGLLERWF